MVPAPWQLRGSAFALLVRPPKAPPWVMAVLMLVRYRDSPVGPYDELLWCRQRRVARRVAWSVGPIVVDSEESVRSGRANWGIPKHRAAFEIAEGALGTSATVFDDKTNKVFADLQLESRGPSVPANSRWMPRFLTTLAQIREGQRFQFAPSTRGRLRYARVHRLATSAPFPTLNRTDVRIAVELDDFDMTFPVADVEAA